MSTWLDARSAWLTDLLVKSTSLAQGCIQAKTRRYRRKEGTPTVSSTSEERQDEDGIWERGEKISGGFAAMCDRSTAGKELYMDHDCYWIAEVNA